MYEGMSVSALQVQGAVKEIPSVSDAQQSYGQRRSESGMFVYFLTSCRDASHPHSNHICVLTVGF